MSLTETWLKANCRKLRSQLIEKADRDGLSVRVTPKGKIVFQIRYRYDGGNHAQRLDLGSYPRMSLKAARAENERLRGELEQGHDPAVVRLLEKQAIARAETVEELFRLWYLKYCCKQKEGHHEILRSFELHVFPKIGALPAAKVTMHQWLDLLEGLAAQKPGICERILTNTKQMLKWGVKRKLIPVNVLSEIYAKEDFQIDDDEEEHRSLSDDEINRVWRAIEQSRMAFKNKLFLKLCIFFGCRNGELRRSQKTDFDFTKKVWTVPIGHNKVRKKVRKPILRPIISEIEPLLRQAIELSGSGNYVFSNAGTDEPMGKSAPVQLPYNLMQWLRRHEKYEMEHWSVHSLRKTARTNFSSLTEPHIAEIMLGHKLPKNWRIYDHYTYLKEQAEAYRAWWQRLMKLTSEDYECAPAPAAPKSQPVPHPIG